MLFCLVFYITTAPKIFAISSRTGKNSCHNFARLSACCLHGKINSTIFTYHALIPCFFVLIFTSLPRRKSLLSVQSRTKTPAAISQDCRLAVYTEKPIAQFLHIMPLSPVFCLDFYITTAPKIFAISSRTDKNSCRNFARLSVWCFVWVGHPHPN